MVSENAYIVRKEHIVGFNSVDVSVVVFIHFGCGIRGDRSIKCAAPAKGFFLSVCAESESAAYTVSVGEIHYKGMFKA